MRGRTTKLVAPALLASTTVTWLGWRLGWLTGSVLPLIAAAVVLALATYFAARHQRSRRGRQIASAVSTSAGFVVGTLLWWGFIYYECESANSFCFG
jgi:hypothetical protein